MFWKILQYWDRRQLRKRWLTFIVVLLAFTVLMTVSDGLRQVNWLIADGITRLDTRAPSPDIVIISIDDESIRAIGSWPWGRDVHAGLLDGLAEAGARSVGFDVIMTEQHLNSANGDQKFAEALKQHDSAILPIIAYPPHGGGGWMEVILPIFAQSDQNISLAHISLSPDSDGVARTVYLREGRDGVGGGVWYHMAAMLWLKGDLSRSVEQLQGNRAPQDILDTLDSIETNGVNPREMAGGWLRDYEVLVPYGGGAGRFKQYSYYDVYFGLVPKEAFQDKYVLVGAVSASGLGDVYSTPNLGSEAVMPGVEIIANVLDGLLQNEYRYEATVWQNLIYNLLIVVLMIPLFYLARPRGVLIGAVVLIALDLWLAFAMRYFVGMQVMPAASLLTLSLAYPFWAWRRLEQAMSYIRLEFVRMRRENGFFRFPQHLTGDQLERDLQIFESASWQLRELQQMVRQSMDALPYILMLTDEKGQVVFSNMQARQFFRVDPPLPTMAFEPAMGMEGKKSGMVEAHGLGVLLKSYFMASLSTQVQQSAYAESLLAYLQQRSLYLPEGVIEVVDTKKNRSFLLKIIDRTSTIERSQGWIVSLIELSGVQQAEVQRDQVLRYLHENIVAQLAHFKEVTEVSEVPTNSMGVDEQKTIGQLHTQLNSFLAFQYAQTSIYFYEKVDLFEVLESAYHSVMESQPSLGQGGIHNFKEPVVIQGDAQMLKSAFVTLIKLTVSISAGEKMPQVKVSERVVDHESSEGEHKAQVMLIIATNDDDVVEKKEKLLSQDIQLAGFPDEVSAELFDCWSIKTIVNKHSG